MIDCLNFKSYIGCLLRNRGGSAKSDVGGVASSGLVRLEAPYKLPQSGRSNATLIKRTNDKSTKRALQHGQTVDIQRRQESEEEEAR